MLRAGHGPLPGRCRPGRRDQRGGQRSRPPRGLHVAAGGDDARGGRDRGEPPEPSRRIRARRPGPGAPTRQVTVLFDRTPLSPRCPEPLRRPAATAAKGHLAPGDPGGAGRRPRAHPHRPGVDRRLHGDRPAASALARHATRPRRDGPQRPLGRAHQRSAGRATSVVAGTVLGFVVWIFYRPDLEATQHHVIGLAAPWPTVVAALVLGAAHAGPGVGAPRPHRSRACPSSPPSPDGRRRPRA